MDISNFNIQQQQLWGNSRGTGSFKTVKAGRSSLGIGRWLKAYINQRESATKRIGNKPVLTSEIETGIDSAVYKGVSLRIPSKVQLERLTDSRSCITLTRPPTDNPLWPKFHLTRLFQVTRERSKRLCIQSRVEAGQPQRRAQSCFAVEVPSFRFSTSSGSHFGGTQGQSEWYCK